MGRSRHRPHPAASPAPAATTRKRHGGRRARVSGGVHAQGAGRAPGRSKGLHRRRRRGVARRVRRPQPRLALPAAPRPAGGDGHGPPGVRGRCCRPWRCVSPVVPGAQDRQRQGVALHRGTGRRHRRQGVPPHRPGLAAAGRCVPRAAHLYRDLRGGARRRWRPPRSGRASGIRGE